MYRLFSLLLISGTLLGTARPFLAQDAATQAAAIAEQKEREERYRVLRGAIDDLTEALAVQQRKIAALTAEINKLREENANLSSKFSGYVSRDDLRKLAEKMQEMETKREGDKKLILEEIQRLAKVAATVPAPIERKPVNSKPPVDATQDFYPYTIKRGDTLSEIVKLYNAELKERGLPPVTLEQVKKANSKVNPDRLPAGKEILLPVPSK
jgi:chromosome segregation ATPase